MGNTKSDPVSCQDSVESDSGYREAILEKICPEICKGLGEEV
jgi:hypothetical protein